MPSPRTLFFDVGDTLVFDRPALPERLRQALVTTGLADPALETLTAAVRTGERVALAHYLDGFDWAEETALRPATQAIVSTLGGSVLTDAQWKALRGAFLSVPFTRNAHDGAEELLNQMQERGFRLGVISDWDDTLEDVLKECGLLHFFATVTVSCKVGHTKPHRAMFQDALRQMGAQPSDCLHVGDWYELDVCGARAVGMNTLLFDHAGRAPHADCPRVTTSAELSQFLLARYYDL